MTLRFALLSIVVAGLTLSLTAQTSNHSAASVSVPPVLQFSNVATDLNGTPLTGTVSIAFSLYNNSQGGPALWTEAQTVQLDGLGHYSVYLGVTKANGIPTTLFTNGEAHWLGVKIASQPEQQPRIFLVSVPYAMKAGDAATIGGLPPSAFVMATSPNAGLASESGTPPTTASNSFAPTGPSDVTTSGGTVGTIPLFSTSTDIENSVVAQTGTGSSTKVTIGVTEAEFGDAFAFGAKSSGLSAAYTLFPLTGSAPFLHMCCNNQLSFLNVFVGGAGNLTNTRTDNSVGLGYQALSKVGTGTVSGTVRGNTAVGYQSLSSTTTGAENTAVGWLSGQSTTAANANTTGTQNTFLGYAAGPGSATQLTNATAIGANAAVTENNALVLGSVSGTNGATSTTSVGIGTTAPAYGLDVHGTGHFTQAVTFGSPVDFATGQTFPGAGTITGITAGSGLSGGGSTGSVTLTNTGMLGLTAGTGISLTSGQSPTVSVNTTQVPLLSSANTFTNSQAVSGSLTATGVVSGGSFWIGADLFDFGNFTNMNAFLGFAGNTTMSGTFNTGTGFQALTANTTGYYNTANGNLALSANQTGAGNTAVGASALTTGINGNTSGSFNVGLGFFAGQTLDGSNTTASNNTFLGAGAAASTGTLSNATVVGSNAEVAESNALVLGSIKGVNSAAANVNVGIGTTAPKYTLHVVDNGSGGYGIGSVSSIVGDSAVYGSNTATSGVGTNGASFYTASPQGSAVVGVNTASGGLAAYFEGNVTVTGTLSKGGGSFKIDDPLDPANKYLYHSFVESPDMMNIYNGVATLDVHGAAWITLPKYFEALNRDFRYQLTSMGRPQPNLYVAHEISANRFRISGGKPGGKVSWQVTGIRQDAFANAHRIPTEELKSPQEQGRYLHPELFGAPPEQAVGYRAPAQPTEDEIAATQR